MVCEMLPIRLMDSQRVVPTRRNVTHLFSQSKQTLPLNTLGCFLYNTMGNIDQPWLYRRRQKGLVCFAGGYDRSIRNVFCRGVIVRRLNDVTILLILGAIHSRSINLVNIRSAATPLTGAVPPPGK